MAKLQLDTTTIPFSINTPVRIIASGGMGGDFFGCIALTGATTSKGGGLQTVIRVIDPDTGALTQKPWRTDFLEAVGEDFELNDDEIEEIEKLKCAIQEKKKLQCVTSSQESAEPQSPPTSSESAPHNLLKLTKTQKQSCDREIPTPQSTQTSEPTLLQEGNTAFTGSLSPAPGPQTPEPEPDSIILNPPSGEKPCAAFVSDNPDLSLWNSLKGLSNEDFEQSLEDSEWLGIVATLRSFYQQRNSELCTKETEFLSCPTLTSGSKTEKSRAAGTTKCERWFKENGLIPPGYQLSAPAMAVLMGLPEDLFNPLCPPQADQAVESALVTLPDEQSHQAKLRSPSEESHTSIALPDELSEDKSLSNVPVGTFEIMTEAEARAAVIEINGYCNKIRALLVELEQRQGYVALGFKNMSALMQSGMFLKARSTLQKELQAGRIEREHLNVPVGTFPERHFRPTAKIKPEHYKAVFEKASEIAADRPTTEKDIGLAVATMLRDDPTVAKRGIVDVIKERTFVPLTDNPQYQVNDAVRIKAGGNDTLRSYDGYWGVIDRISAHFYHISISLKKEVIGCKGYEVERLDLEEKAIDELRQISDRVSQLVRLDLEPVEYSVLETLQRSLSFTPTQLMFLEIIEKKYGTIAADRK